MRFSLQGQARRAKWGNEVVDMTTKSFCTLVVYECLKRAARRKNPISAEVTGWDSRDSEGLSKLKVRKVLVMNKSDRALLSAEDDMSVSVMND